MIDLDELGRLARTAKAIQGAGQFPGIWPPALDAHMHYRSDIADLIAAASPDVILDLIAQLRAARATIERMKAPRVPVDGDRFGPF